MKQLLSLLLVLSLAACSAGPRAEPRQTALATEESFSAPLQPKDSKNSDDTKLDSTPEPDPGVEVQLIQEPAPARVINPYKPMVALTFDDGPHAVYTDQILDILEEHHAVATFFEVATNLSKAPDAVRRAADLGCEIGSHSYRHGNLGKMSQEAIQADLAAADEAFVQVLGQAPALLRPPYGSINKALKTSSGKTLVTWSIDPQDWLSKNAEKVVSHVESFKDLDGQVILLHSIYGSTVEAPRVLVPWLQEQGYQLVTVSELLTLRFQQEVAPNRLYNYDFFRWQVPPLPEAPAETAVKDLTIAQGDTFLGDGTAVTVKLIMTEGTQLAGAASPLGGGYAFSGDNWVGRCALQVWQEDYLLASQDLEEAFGKALLFNTTGFPLCFDDYNGDGSPELSLGQWFSSNATCYVLYTLDETGTPRLLTQPAGVICSDGKPSSPYSTSFEKTEEGFAVSCYDNAQGQFFQTEYRWSSEQGLFLLAV